jgi:hypothetical protein
MKNNPNQSNEDNSDVEVDSGAVVQSPFDRLLSRTLMQKEAAQELLRSHLPAEFVAHLKPETLEQADTSFIDANLKRRFVDRLFKVELSDEMARELGTESPHVHVLVLVDHKSSPDKNTVVQMLGYILRIWEHSIENDLPLVPVSWRRYVPGLEIPILDVSRMSDSDMVGEKILHITLVLLKYGRDPSLPEVLRQLFRSVADKFEGQRASTLLDTIRKYVMSVNPVVGENEIQGIFSEFWPVKPEPGSIADQLLTKGRQEGRQEGQQEGEKKGEIKLIRTLESILGVSGEATDLSDKSLDELQQITESLQERINQRGI